MKKIICLLFLTSCGFKEYKYKIEKKVYTPVSNVDSKHNAIWYTDSIRFKNDTIFYNNSYGSVVQINPPYTIYKLK